MKLTTTYSKQTSWYLLTELKSVVTIDDEILGSLDPLIFYLPAYLDIKLFSLKSIESLINKMHSTTRISSVLSM